MPRAGIRVRISDILNNHILLTIVVNISGNHLAGFVPSREGGLRRKQGNIFEGADAGRSGRTGKAALIFGRNGRGITYGCITCADGNTACTQCHGGGRPAVVLQRTKIKLGTGNRGSPSKPRLGNEVTRCRGRGNQVGSTMNVIIQTAGTIHNDGVGNVNGAITMDPTSPSGSISRDGSVSDGKSAVVKKAAPLISCGIACEGGIGNSSSSGVANEEAATVICGITSKC